MSFREVRRKLEAAGFQEVSQRGSPIKFARRFEEQVRVVIVPNHREIAVGTLRSILRQAGLDPVEFDEL